MRSTALIGPRNWRQDRRGAIFAGSLRTQRASARPDRLRAYYRRQLADCEEHIGPDAVWLDSLVADKDDDSARSVDVWLTKSSAAAPGLPDQEQELTVTILTVECEGIAGRTPLAASR